MSEEDDWFERALRETDEESDERPVGAADDGAETEADDGAETEADDKADDDGVDPAERGSDDTAAGLGSATDDSGNDDPFGGAVDEDEESGSSGLDDGSTGDEPIGDSSTDGVPADAFGDVDGGARESDSFGADDPFGGSRGGGGSGGAAEGGASGGGGSGGDPFGGYRGSAAPGGDDDFGFGEFGGDGDGGGEAGFDVDPEEFDSEISRTDVGIEGLDDMILGGVPRRSLLSVIGGAGTGKTTFALQFLNHALEAGNKGIYITLEQTRESIFDTADEKGWSFREHAAEDRLAVVAIDPIEMANSLSSIRNDLVRLIAEFNADRLVLDSVSLLEMMYDHPAKRRSEVFGFTRSLKEAGVTTLLTSEASEETPYASRHGIVEYLTDAVFVLQYVRGSDFRETRLAVEIQKIRDANHSRETKPYDITDTGISVYDQANIF
jgi:KaiC domain protein